MPENNISCKTYKKTLPYENFQANHCLKMLEKGIRTLLKECQQDLSVDGFIKNTK